MFLHVFRQGEPSWESDCLWVAFGCLLVDLWAARVTEVEKSGDFVEGFAGGVVDGFTEQLDVVEEVIDFEQGRVPTRDEKRDGWRDNLATFENIDANVANEVVDGIERFAGCYGQSLGCTNANHEGAG